MHEISLVRNIFKTLEAEFAEDEIRKLKSIHLKVGLLSNVEPLLMQNAYAAVTATDAPHFAHVRLEVEVLPVRVHCLSCGQESEIAGYRFVCEHCGVPCNNIVQGLELLISHVDVND